MSDGTDLTVAAPAGITNAEIDSTYRLAKALSMSGLFKDARQAELAFAKIMIGRDLGLSATQALMNLHIIEGKPELSANLQATLVRRAPGYDYRVAKLTDEGCAIEFLRDGESLGMSTFTIKDAQKAGLAGKGVWKSYPRNMCFARAMSNGVAFFCPEVTGGIRIYSEGEVGGEVVPPAVSASVESEPEVLVIDGIVEHEITTSVIEQEPQA